MARVSYCLLLVTLAGLAACRDSDRGSESRPFVVAGYLPSYRLDTWDEAHIGPVNHLLYFHVLPAEDGAIPENAIPDAVRSRLAKIRRATGTRLSLTVGGWGHSETFAAVVADDDKRAVLVASLAAIQRETVIDSFDFDWEHPETPEQWADYVTLLSEVRRFVRPTGGVCTVAISPWKQPPRELFEAVDRVHLMSYDHDYPHATFDKTTADIERLLAWGCPAGKLVLGIPFYGRAKSWDAVTYAQLVTDGRVGNGDLTADGVAFNGPATVSAKVRLARRLGLAGVMVWELGQDTADPQTSLLHSVEREVLSK